MGPQLTCAHNLSVCLNDVRLNGVDCTFNAHKLLSHCSEIQEAKG